jgi:hypothetical protein
LSFQPSALSFQLLNEAKSAFAWQMMKYGYEMIVRQRRVILCKPSTKENMRPGWRLPPRSLRRGGRGAGHPQLDKFFS